MASFFSETELSVLLIHVEGQQQLELGLGGCIFAAQELLRDATPSVIKQRLDIDAHLPDRTLRHVLQVVGLLEEPRHVGDAASEEGRVAGHVLAKATDALGLADLDRMPAMLTFVNACARYGLVVGLCRELECSLLGREAYARCSREANTGTETLLPSCFCGWPSAV